MVSSAEIIGELFLLEQLDGTQLTDGSGGSTLSLDHTIQIHLDSKIKIGRAKVNTLQIHHPAVSNFHCVIWTVQFDENSVPLVYLKDLSLNGTFVNGVQLQKDQIQVLNHNDVITVKCGAKLEFLSIFGDNEEAVGRTIILEEEINTEFPDWLIKNRVLGNGTFGFVFVSERKSDSKLCAVKVVKNNFNHVPFEAQALLKLKHPNIIRVYETHLLNNKLYIFEDLISGGDLFSYLTKGDMLNSIPESEALVKTFQILKALEYLHHNRIVHRDLKLDNILLESNSDPFTRLILTDFGIAKSVSSTKRRMFTTVGTPEYCAPEVGFEHTKIPEHLKTGILGTSSSRSRKGYDFKCDVWSLGVIVHIMLTSISPFYGDGNEINIIRNVKSGRLNLGSNHWKAVSPAARDFVQNLLRVDIEQRFSVDDCFRHEWVRRHRADMEKIYSKIVQKSSL